MKDPVAAEKLGRQFVFTKLARRACCFFLRLPFREEVVGWPIN